MRRSIAFCAILSLSSAAGFAAVHIPADGIVVARQAAMKEMARAAKTISDMFECKLSYDVVVFKDAAETIRRQSGDALGSEFPFGSFGGPSDATAEIDKSRITKGMRMGQGIKTGGSLLGKTRAGKAEADPSPMPAEHVFHLMLQDCASCHAKFREKAQ